MESINRNARSLMEFLDKSPVNFYAVRTVAERLDSGGFTRLDSRDAWQLKPGGKYYMVKNGTAIFGFTVASEPVASAGFRIIAAHSDSPCFRVKPNPEMLSDGGVVKLNVEVYGGPILYTWFDRPLSLAGRVVMRSDDTLHPESKLIKIDRPLLTIPHLSIHITRSLNEVTRISAQKDMLPVAAIVKEAAEKDGLLLRLIAEAAGCSTDDILDFDLSLYDTTPACLVGMNNEFVTSGRLDDLSMVHAAMEALVSAQAGKQTCVMAIFDNEETGSGTKQGAASPILADLLRRITDSFGGTREDFVRAVEN
ncbi:MAG: M18 family aminopeptidase, partial [Duncaniella sp.]|nr:M18 family aminopeptidase [Duncaniella sp.]